MAPVRDGDVTGLSDVAASIPGFTGLKVLGSGGLGEVVLARHEASGTLGAIKYLRSKLLADPQFRGAVPGGSGRAGLAGRPERGTAI